jgi:hypothetical protein
MQYEYNNQSSIYHPKRYKHFKDSLTYSRRTERMKFISRAIAMLVVLSTMMLCIPLTEALEYNVTVRWNVPADYSLTISYKSSTWCILFQPAGKNFTGLGALNQTYATNPVYALNITNSGNTPVTIRANFSMQNGYAMAQGVTFFNVTSNNADRNWVYWVVANATTQQVISTGLAAQATAPFWAFSTGTNVVSGGTSKTLKLNSAAS